MVSTGYLKRGFTLVELLIAMSIMLSMLVLASVAYQSYTKSWQRDLSKIEQSYQDFRYNELFIDAVQSIFPLAVTDEDRSFYFLGREEGFTAVTYSPIFATGFPAVIRVFRELNDEGNYRLVYEEASLQHIVLKSPQQVLPFNKRKIIYSNISDLKFSYYGWKNNSSKMASLSADLVNAGRGSWFSEYDGIKRRLHPDKVKIQIGDFSVGFTMPDRSRLNITREEIENPV